MLIGFLVCSEDDWTEWKKAIKHVQGKAVIHVADSDPARPGAVGYEGREDAINEVEPLSDDDNDEGISS
jgi:cysteine protease ATG4